MANGNKTFMRITNRDIYSKIEKLENRMHEYHEKMDKKVDEHHLLIQLLGAGGLILFSILLSHLFGIGV